MPDASPVHRRLVAFETVISMASLVEDSVHNSSPAFACRGGSQLVQLDPLASGPSLRVRPGVSELPGYLLRSQCIIQHLLACRGGSQLVQFDPLTPGPSLWVRPGVSELPG